MNIGADQECTECNDVPSNLEAFMQRLRDMSKTESGIEYIKSLCPETINYLNEAGYADEITKLLALKPIVKVLIYKQDPIYYESYIEKLRTEVGAAGGDNDEDDVGVKAFLGSDYSLKDMSEPGQCTNNIEMPWFKIALPDKGTYKLIGEAPVHICLCFSFSVNSKNHIIYFRNW